MEIFLQPESWIAILTLTFLEIILGIDNIIFISIVVNKIPEKSQQKTRLMGVSCALIFRIILLLCITWIIKSTSPLFVLWSHGVSVRDAILFIGGLFLIYKSTSEIHHKMIGSSQNTLSNKKNTILITIVQIMLLDIIFSFDSILTAIGLTKEVLLMITAVVISMIVMSFFASYISKIINKYPSLQILALSFLILIGFNLIIDGLHYEVPKGYIYFAVFFSILVELLNLKIVRKTK